MSETADYRCTVTLLLEDVPEDVARRFFEEGNKVDSFIANENYVASMEAPSALVRAS